MNPEIPAPKFRRLRVFAFDPALSRSVETLPISETTLSIIWECEPEDLGPGPVGDYLEVVDYDPGSKRFYDPVDLDHPFLLAQDGLPPSEANPMFHQQMVYAVAMHTIRSFELALGRSILWAVRLRDENGARITDLYGMFVRRLRLYPHALREANAYYSPRKKSILFGYLPSPASENAAGSHSGMVFTCLSHDIIAHEVTHAIVDGLHRRYIEPSNPDVLAFHEAFADIVALFQHFSLPGVVDHQVAKTQGDLEKQNLLGKLAFQLGKALGKRGGLRDYLGSIDEETQEWRPKKPDPGLIGEVFEPHKRGSLLVAALFGAFLKMYKRRIADLLRIATGGSGVLPPGDIHPDLVNRLANEARKTARHLLQISIRALDYSPPVDITFGDFLRALVTADFAMVPNDPHGYRAAIIESFEQWGIYPRKVRSLSLDSLLWTRPSESDQKKLRKLLTRKENGETVSLLEKLYSNWNLRADRKQVFKDMENNGKTIRDWFVNYGLSEANAHLDLEPILGLQLGEDAKGSIRREWTEKDPKKYLPKIEVHSVRWASRQSPDGDYLTDIVIEITQKRRAFFKKKTQDEVDKERPTDDIKGYDFNFRGGCTLLLSADTGDIRYIISKRVANDHRLERQRDYMTKSGAGSPSITYFGTVPQNRAPGEPFAFLHR